MVWFAAIGGESEPERKPEALFRRFHQTHDPKLREELILLHRSLVHFYARKFANRGEPIEDLIQAGMIGLINAIDRFDPTRGIRFATYATPTVIGEIKRHFRDRGWAIKVPRRLQEINLEATKAVDRLSQQLSRSPTVEEIASEIGHSEDETLEAIEMGRYYDLVSLDAVLGNDDDGSQMPLGEHIGVEDRGLARFELRKRLEEALEQLGARERAIVRFRFFNGLSQTETARRLGISQMHVSRLQHRAMSRLREILREGD